MVRIAVGLGLSGAAQNLIAIAAEVVTPHGRRTAVTTIVFCGMSVGGAASALLARFAPPGLDWRAIFLIGGALPMVLAPAIGLVLPGHPHHDGEARGAMASPRPCSASGGRCPPWRCGPPTP